jgi:RNA polymerase sigma-70 factor (ECF subfamily)
LPSSDLTLTEDARAKVALWAGDHWDGVFALLYRLTRNRHEAEDLTQETFLRAARQNDSFQPGTNLRAWLMRIAVNAHLDQRRRQHVARSEPLPDDVPATGAAPCERLAGAELAAALERAMGQLPELARAVFLLRTREELSFREIGEAIQTTEETARWHMLQARRRLLQELGEWI